MRDTPIDAASRPGLRTHSVPVLLAIVLGGAAWYSLRRQPALTERPDDALQFAGNAACSSCHSTIVKSFTGSPHSETLVPMATAPIRSRLVGQKFPDPARDAELEFLEMEGNFSVRSGRYADGTPVELQWCFGSGQHAHTLVGVLHDPGGQQWLLQCRLSWYRAAERLALTPGESSAGDAEGIAWLGRLLDEGQLRRCFGCHTTYLAEQAGTIDFGRSIPGVQCERCHGPRQQHVASAGRRAARVADVPGLDQKTALESIRWCGGCHRQDELAGPMELDPRNVQLVRFAPIGLVQSRCFRESPPALQPTCLTCHDPHHAAQHEPVAYSAHCRKCHAAGTSASGRLCKVQPVARDCLPCHMPKVSFGGTTFTDHWIRVRHESPPPASPVAHDKTPDE